MVFGKRRKGEREEKVVDMIVGRVFVGRRIVKKRNRANGEYQ